MNHHNHDFPARFYSKEKQNAVIDPVKIDKPFKHVPGDQVQIQQARFYKVGAPTILLAMLIGVYFMF